MQRAVLVCRVIVGRVKRNDGAVKGQETEDLYDSLRGGSPRLDELIVLNAGAVLPCFSLFPCFSTS